YTIAVHNRHDDPAALEALGKTSLYMDRQLKKKIPVRFFRDSAGETAAGTLDLLPGEERKLWVAAPAADARPEGAEPGDRLRGTFTLGKSEENRVGAGNRPGGWPLEITVTPEADAEEEEPTASDADDDPRSPRDRVAEAVRDLQVKRLAGMKDDDDFAALARDILSDWPDHLPVLVAQLERTDADEGAGNTKEIVRAADRVIRAVDRDALAAHFGKGLDPEDPAAEREDKERKAEREALRTALYHKARALARAAAEADGGADPAAVEAAREAYREFQTWGEKDAEETLDLRVWNELAQGRPARALAELHAGLGQAEKPDRARYERRIDLLERLGWTHWAERARRDLAVRFPETPRVF
ncbi:MAG: hypothetical protein HKN12_06325, partial [Gemmatimonadetes bacterium]|nr:hypothetical protein [Gemmatimonadota bacterium]